MGIGNFHAWTKERHPDAYVDVSRMGVDHLYLDMSSLFHPVVRKSRSKDEFIAKLYAKLSYILSSVQPRKSVVMAMDGPAPLAKWLTQRSRREKDARKARLSGMKGGQGLRAMAKQALTPGTSFMADVEDALEFYILQKLVSQAWMSVEFELLSSAVEGEGELKIIERLNASRRCVVQGDKHMIVGGDSDLMLMALLCGQPDLYIVNDDDVLLRSLQSYKNENMHKEAANSRKSLRAFSPDHLREIWKASEESALLAESPEALQQLSLDFAAIVIMTRGNDYLPKVRGSLARDAVWDRYLQKRQAAGGRPLVLDTAGSLLKAGGDPWEQYTHVLDINVELMYEVLGGPKGTPLIDSTASVRLADKRVELFLQGVAWNLTMYTAARCFDYHFVYHTRGPDVTEICEALQQPGALGSPAHALAGDNDRVAEREAGGKLNGRPLPPHVFAMALLPGIAAPFVPQPLRPLMLPDSPIYDIYEVCEVCEEASKEARMLDRVRKGLTKQLDAKKLQLGGVDDSEEAEQAYLMLKAKFLKMEPSDSHAEDSADEDEEEEEDDDEDEEEDYDDYDVSASWTEDIEEDEASGLFASALALEERLNHLGDLNRENVQRTMAHMAEVHRNKPFPVARLVEAVNSVPLDEYTRRERELLAFGKSYVYFTSQGRHGEAVRRSPPPPMKGWDKIWLGRKNIRRELVEVGGTRNPADVPDSAKKGRSRQTYRRGSLGRPPSRPHQHHLPMQDQPWVKGNSRRQPIRQPRRQRPQGFLNASSLDCGHSGMTVGGAYRQPGAQRTGLSGVLSRSWRAMGQELSSRSVLPMTRMTLSSRLGSASAVRPRSAAVQQLQQQQQAGRLVAKAH